MGWEEGLSNSKRNPEREGLNTLPKELLNFYTLQISIIAMCCFISTYVLCIYACLS